MKVKKIAALVILAVVFALPGICLAASNTTNEENKDSSSSTAGTTAATVTTSLIQNRIMALTGGGSGGGSGSGGSGGGQQQSGQSSGDGTPDFAVWALGGVHSLHGTRPSALYEGTLSVATVGVDKIFGQFLAGIGVGYERLDLTTKYNAGKMEYDGLSITPYLSYAFTSTLVADASLSYVFLNYDMRDTQNNVKYHDDMRASRKIAVAGLSKYFMFDKLMLTTRLGTMYMHESQGSYRLNTTDYSATGIFSWQGTAGMRATYDMGAFKPFAGGTFMKDFVKSGARTIDKWGADFDLGFGYNVTDRFNVGLTGTYGTREYLDKYGLMLNVRYDF